MEIVLGVDNVVFIAVLTGRLPARQQERARRVGLTLALGLRILLLLAITWMMGLRGRCSRSWVRWSRGGT
jgi:predicted tellurium resistance membrane protein TerC